jgi:hypothetical protein
VRRHGSPPVAYRGAVQTADEAVHLLRTAGPRPLAAWCIGTVPFVLGFLFYWEEMSRSPFARSRLLGASFAVAVSYAWMKAWHVRFVQLLQRALDKGPGPVFDLRALARTATRQIRVQPTSFIALPLAALAMLPFAWVYAFYQNLSVVGHVAGARRQAALWPVQNHQLIAVLWLCFVVVFVNVMSAILLVPWLLHTFLAIETAMSYSPLGMLSSTTLVIAWGLTYLIVGPLSKASYVLRCLDGDSVTSGADLVHELAELRQRGGS